ncbi:tetratricopeptide repeat-containing sensor histidine kinase [uncultured Chryseobacterium sp.]|uniref:tetratricopeptide repeat-containing sensor histidine kinase n=1 Tax=uncultured Chryseobacterium sp. TaxID=259322 RepID=UPI0025E90D1A|nr:tetratricopeptide repeat-containing sensor histidine kinase [uncultured Chryseobacterium sp.]
MRTLTLLSLLLVLFSCEKRNTHSPKSSEGDILQRQGVELLQKNNLESYSKLQQALIYYIKEKDSSKISKTLIVQSIAQNYTGDILGSEETLVEALKYMKKRDESYYSVFGSLGNLKYDQKDYSDAEKWYTKALAEKIDNFEERVNLMNNLSVSKYRQGKYDSAIKILEQINKTKVGKDNLKNRISENILFAKWLKNKNYPVEKKIEELLKHKIQIEDFWGSNSSYSHLAEVNQIKNPEKSLFFAKKMLRNAIKIKSPEDRLEAMERILLVDPSNSKENFTQYKKLADSIQKSRNDYRKSFAYIKYDSEKKEIDNQRLKNDKIEDQNSILRLYIGTVILIIIIIIIVVWYRRRQLKLKQEKELEVKDTQLKMSKKVHDVVANGIYQVMTKIENQEHFDRDTALDELEFVYEKSRDISYDKADEEQEFSKKISELIASFNNDTVKTFTAGNNPALWETISPLVKDEVFQIIRELMVNMKKHSQASHVALRFEKVETSVEIQYKDNGIGIPGDLIYKNGLRNAESRMAAIGGAIIFDTEIEKGLKVNLSVPAS